MSEAALDRGLYFSSPMSDWYRERPFKVAFVVSVLIHGALIAFIPGFRSVPIETTRVLEVEIAPDVAPTIPRIQEKPVVPPKIVEPKIEPVSEPVVRQSQPEPMPEPVVRQSQPEPLPVPRAEITRAPRTEPQPEFVIPKPELRPQPKAEPKLESRPEPKVEPRFEPLPVARVEPRPEPQPTPTVEPRPEPRPEPRIEPRTEVRPEVKPVPRETPSVVQPGVEPSVAAPAVAQPVPAPVATAPVPSVVAPQPQPTAPKIDDAQDRRLLATYGQSISKEIKRYQKYPAPAQRRGWEGTAEVLLQISADGKVTGITLSRSSGHAILDEEALDMVRRAAPLPQAPPDLRGRAHVVSVPIVFRLQNS